jgi:HAD superfamily hydrolase (TIGR01509 family)
MTEGILLLRVDVRAVIFDMDGVLVDSEPLHFEVLNGILAERGQALDRAAYEAFIGTTTEATWATLIERFGLPASLESYLDRYNAALLDLFQRPHPPQPGVVSLIDRLQQQGLPLGLASSSPRLWIDATLGSIGLADRFQTIVAGDDVPPGQGKPAPAIYLLAAARLGVEPAACVAIEDSPNGVLSAHRAGMYVIGVRTPYTAHLTLDGASQVVDSLTQVDLARLSEPPGQDAKRRP